jgi:hypothetical protein
MKIFSLLTLMAALGVATASMLRADFHDRLPGHDVNMAHITDGAFRDGLYLGQLAAERGAEPHAAIGRWATLQDRASFTTGYQRGYTEFLASRTVLGAHEGRVQ